MKPTLLLGLGNPLMGDEGVGWHLARRLAADARLPEYVEVLEGGTDLLRCASRMKGREHVVLVDATMDAHPPGHQKIQPLPASGVHDRQGSAHHLSALAAVDLLRNLEPGCRQTRFTLVTVSVGPVAMGEELSAPLQARLPALAERILREVTRRQGRVLDSTAPEPGRAPDHTPGPNPSQGGAMSEFSDGTLAQVRAEAAAEERAAILSLIEQHMRMLAHGHGATGAQVLRQLVEEVERRQVTRAVDADSGRRKAGS